MFKTLPVSMDIGLSVKQVMYGILSNGCASSMWSDYFSSLYIGLYPTLSNRVIKGAVASHLFVNRLERHYIC